MDIPGFSSKYPPFDALDEERLTEVVRHTHIEFFAGARASFASPASPRGSSTW
jgi:hypothetical protein